MARVLELLRRAAAPQDSWAKVRALRRCRRRRRLLPRPPKLQRSAAFPHTPGLLPEEITTTLSSSALPGAHAPPSRCTPPHPPPQHDLYDALFYVRIVLAVLLGTAFGLIGAQGLIVFLL